MEDVQDIGREEFGAQAVGRGGMMRSRKRSNVKSGLDVVARLDFDHVRGTSY